MARRPLAHCVGRHSTVSLSRLTSPLAMGEGPFARDGAALGDDFGDDPVAVEEDLRLGA